MTAAEIRKQLTKAQISNLRHAAWRRAIGNETLDRELSAYAHRLNSDSIKKLIDLGLLKSRMRIQGDARDRLIEKQHELIDRARALLEPLGVVEWDKAREALDHVADIEQALDDEAMIVTDLGVEVSS